MKTKAKKVDPLRTERAMKKACRMLATGQAVIADGGGTNVVIQSYGTPLAIFDLRDCYRLRAPLKGVTKAIRKAIAPRKRK